MDDAPTRLLLESGLIPKLPSAVELDVRRAVREMLNGITGPVQASLDEFAIISVESEANRLTVRFNFRLIGR